MGFKNNEISARRFFKHYNYLEEMLNYICAPVQNNIRGKILEAYI